MKNKMKNTIKTFRLFVRPGEKSQEVASRLRDLNQKSAKPLTETPNGDLIIAIGGDGTFIRAVTTTEFDKSKVYVGVHTGNLGFLQNISPDEIYSFLQYINHEKEIKTRKVPISSITVNLSTGKKLSFYSLNEILIIGKNYTNISFSEFIDGDLLQKITGCGIIVATSTGDTAFLLNAGGTIDFSNNYQLLCKPLFPTKNAVNENFIENTCICSKISIIPEKSDNITVVIDGIPQEQIVSDQIESIDISITDSEKYINKFELKKYSKVQVVREKILGLRY